MLAILIAVVALSVALWALYIAVIATIETRGHRDALVKLIELVTVAQDEHTAAIQARTKELEVARAHIEALRRKYETTLKLYQESVAIAGPLGSKRVQ